MSENVDNLVNGIYRNGLMKRNRFHIDLSVNTSTYTYNDTNIPVFSVQIPGWDVATTTETNVRGNVKHFPFRKNWTQQLMINFYMENNHRANASMFDVMNRWCNAVAQPSGPQPYYRENVQGNILNVVQGVGDGNGLRWQFFEVFPRVLYPIELMPIEDITPMVFSVQFSYRAYDLRNGEGTLIGTQNYSGGIGT
tara:strand:+ start:12533 stop:13117 length:585 start_codon:yes stop_codon:yes gene_type:complete